MAVYMYLLLSLTFSLVVFRNNKVEAVLAVKGASVQLQCPFKDSGGNQIPWYKKVGGSLTRYADSTNINPLLPVELRSRLSVTGDHTAGEYHLSISDVRKSDDGTYECILSGTGSRSRLQLTVITDTPSNVSIESVGLDKKINGIEGRNLIIKCSAVGGDPAPDVKLLISESVVKVAKQSVHYTLSSVKRSNDGQNVTCLAGYEEISFYPLNDSAIFYLKLKPYPPIFSSVSVITEETKPLTISCKTTGSRPMASIYWLLGNGRANVTTYATQLPHSHDPIIDTYSITSTLTYSLDRTHNGQNLICGASNDATSEHGDSVETSKTLNVRYAPDITVNSPTYTQNDADRTVTCNPSGNPDSYTYRKWQHKSRHGEIIREFGGNKTLKLPDVPLLLRYQDNGEYVCIASNGIRDNDNKFEQTGSGYVTVIAQLVLTYDTFDMVKQFGEINCTVDIYVKVHSVPQIKSSIWSRDGIPITTSAKYKASSSLIIVKDKFHGTEVQLDGFNVTLTIRDLIAEDFTNYTVTLRNGFESVKKTIALEFTGVPETPCNLSMKTISTTSITIVWDPNYGGGPAQTFYIQYRVLGSFSWTTVSAGEEGINEQKRRRTFEVKKLQEKETYELRMFSENTAGKRSNYTEVLIVHVFTASSEILSSSSTIIGGVLGAIVTLGFVCASVMGIVFFKRRQGQDQTKKNDKSHENTGFHEKIKENEYEEVGNRCDVEQKQSSKTYESLGIKGTLNVYDDLENPEGLILSKSSLCLYEALGNQDKPSIYSALQNQKEQTQLRKQPSETDIRKESKNPKENLELYTNQRPVENVYDNEGF